MPIPVLYANQFTLAESENEKIIHIKIAKKELCIAGSCLSMFWIVARAQNACLTIEHAR